MWPWSHFIPKQVVDFKIIGLLFPEEYIKPESDKSLSGPKATVEMISSGVFKKYRYLHIHIFA